MNRLKSYLLLFCAITISFIAFACSGSSDEKVAQEIIIPENVLTNGMNFAKDGESKSLSIKATVSLTLTSNQDWCKVTQVSSTANGVYKYDVTASANSTTAQRTASISVKGGDLPEQKINVTQQASDGLDIEQAEYKDIPATGGAISVRVMANGEPKVTINDHWITEATTRAMTDKSKSFNIAANVGKERTGSITFALGSAKTTVTVTQQAGSQGGTPNAIAGETPWEVAKSLGLGWNLGNQMDAQNNGVANETCWGNQKATQTTFDKLAAAGITTVRIPVTWLGHIGSAPSYEIEKAWLDRVYEIVGYAENAGLNAIINMHHDGADGAYWLDIKGAANSSSKNTEVKAQIKAMWTQIAERFKSKGHFLAFESFNEIHDGGWGWGDNTKDGGKQYTTLNEWNQVFVDAVRGTGGENANRFLGVPGYCTNADLTINNFKMPTDKVQNRLMVAVHFYDPNEYTLEAKYSEWGHLGAASKKASWGDEANVKSVFGKLKTAYVDKGIPIYIGEMGCVRRADNRGESFRKYYLEYVCKAAKEYGMAPIYWDNGATGAGKEHSGLFNHGTGDYVNNAEDVVRAMKKGVFTEDASYTLQSVYDNAANIITD